MHPHHAHPPACQIPPGRPGAADPAPPQAGDALLPPNPPREPTSLSRTPAISSESGPPRFAIPRPPRSSRARVSKTACALSAPTSTSSSCAPGARDSRSTRPISWIASAARCRSSTPAAGKDAHPTQALLDIYTLERSFEKRGGIDGKTIGLMGGSEAWPHRTLAHFSDGALLQRAARVHRA